MVKQQQNNLNKDVLQNMNVDSNLITLIYLL